MVGEYLFDDVLMIGNPVLFSFWCSLFYSSRCVLFSDANEDNDVTLLGGNSVSQNQVQADLW